jgi:hypothetical protein
MASPSGVRFLLLLKALQELGLTSTVLYAVYQVGLKSGFIRWLTPPKPFPPFEELDEYPEPVINLLEIPSPENLKNVLSDRIDQLIAEAEEIIQGKMRLFGVQAIPFDVAQTGPLIHWTLADKHPEFNPPRHDIKFIWEPARLGWVFTLGRAYCLSGDARYSQAFWDLIERFLRENPPNLGVNWASGQEVALRILALVFGWCVFAAREEDKNRRALIKWAVVTHAERIPPTMIYARAQNNNHLLIEAIGLYTAGVFMPQYKHASQWRRSGWQWANWVFQNQILDDGCYIQQSTNYHRLMLHAALWMDRLARYQQQPFLVQSSRQLALATRWLIALFDPLSGRVPNLGSNDGANILPLAVGEFEDYRPVLQAASRAFLGQPLLSSGSWDELGLWLGQPLNSPEKQVFNVSGDQETFHLPVRLHRISTKNSWAYLRAAKFSARPSHADQLHLDLWWRGINVALDAGTYQYNALPPWDNSLAGTSVHNTVMIDGQDQMNRAGRFLWVNWAQAATEDNKKTEGGALQQVAASHNGYCRLDIKHRRVVICTNDDQWLVEDHLVSCSDKKFFVSEHQAYLQWLMPDWQWKFENNTLSLLSPYGWINIDVMVNSVLTDDEIEKVKERICYQLVRSGQILFGEGDIKSVRGWYSPTYGYKIPALSYGVVVPFKTPIKITTRWVFPDCG